MKQKEFSNKDLIFMLKKGDVSAFDSVYKEYSQQVYSYAFGIVKSREISKSIVQEVFIIFWDNKKNIKDFKALESFLFDVMHRLLIKHLEVKKAKNRSELKVSRKSFMKGYKLKTNAVNTGIILAKLDFQHH